MGTNYYLKKKIDFNPEDRLPATVGLFDGQEEPIELVNGWVWNNKYYPTVEELNKEFYQKIHIGLSSIGRRFFLCRYPSENPRFKDEPWAQKWLDAPIDNLEDWIKLFNQEDTKIVSDCGEEVSPNEMLDIITNRMKDENLTNCKDEWVDFPRDNNQYRVINGLIVHDESKERFGRPNLIEIMPSEYSYDLVWSGNDNDVGMIFR